MQLQAKQQKPPLQSQQVQQLQQQQHQQQQQQQQRQQQQQQVQHKTQQQQQQQPQQPLAPLQPGFQPGPQDQPQPRKDDGFALGFFPFLGWYCVLFLKHWFGDRSAADANNDGEFDPEDVIAYVRKRRGLDPPRGRKQIRRKKAATATTASQAPARAAAAAAEQEDEDEDEEEVLIAQGLRRRRPWFIIFQCLVPLSFWAIFAASQDDTSDLWQLVAGLETVLPGKTILQVHSNSCEDFRYEVWRWWSYQLTHVGLGHIGMNCLLNLLLGIPLEGIHGHLRMFVMFQLGVAGGALSLFINDPHASVVGMSGGCYSLFGIHYADLLLNWGQIRFRYAVLCGLSFLLLLDFGNYVLTSQTDSTSHSVHAGGALAGAVGGALLCHNIVVRANERLLQGVVFVMGTVLTIFCLVWNWSTWAPRSLTDTILDSSDGWCWRRIVYDKTISSAWFCVQCGDQSCIDRWSLQTHIRSVSNSLCESLSLVEE